ncbi:MAG: YdcF family protein [Tetragenococcus koreensis]|nr:YdcF family protein [Tetragenococcus koreensis]
MKEQAIIVLGYPVKSLEHLLQRRLQLAQKDAEKNQINCIIVSGKGREGINEAEYMANWLVENGYEGRIIKERDSWDTIENLRFCNEICIKK